MENEYLNIMIYIIAIASLGFTLSVSPMLKRNKIER